MSVDRVRPVEGMFDLPDETQLQSTESHDPTHWVRCTECATDNPADGTTCHRCGEPLIV